MKQDRFLLWILIGIGALAALALALFFIRKGTASAYGPDDTPEGVVRNYVLAVFQGDYEKAYGYLADKENKPTLEQFRWKFLRNYVNPDNIGVEIGRIWINDDKALVTVYTQFGPGDPFSSSYRDDERALLVKQGGQWKIEEMPYSFWDYNWYE